MAAARHRTQTLTAELCGIGGGQQAGAYFRLLVFAGVAALAERVRAARAGLSSAQSALSRRHQRPGLQRLGSFFVTFLQGFLPLCCEVGHRPRVRWGPEHNTATPRPNWWTPRRLWRRRGRRVRRPRQRWRRSAWAAYRSWRRRSRAAAGAQGPGHCDGRVRE